MIHFILYRVMQLWVWLGGALLSIIEGFFEFNKIKFVFCHRYSLAFYNRVVHLVLLFYIQIILFQHVYFAKISVTHFSPYFQDIECWIADFNATLCLFCLQYKLTCSDQTMIVNVKRLNNFKIASIFEF